MPKLIPEWLWPRLTLSTTADSAQQRWLREEQDKVDQGYWADISDVALEEARRLFDAEHERRRGADSKAGLYLAAITTLMPILASILPGLWDKQISTCQRGGPTGDIPSSAAVPDARRLVGPQDHQDFRLDCSIPRRHRRQLQLRRG